MEVFIKTDVSYLHPQNKVQKVNWLSSIPSKYKEEIVKQVNLEAIKNGEKINEFATEVSNTYQVMLNIKSSKIRNKSNTSPKKTQETVDN